MQYLAEILTFFGKFCKKIAKFSEIRKIFAKICRICCRIFTISGRGTQQTRFNFLSARKIKSRRLQSARLSRCNIWRHEKSRSAPRSRRNSAQEKQKFAKSVQNFQEFITKNPASVSAKLSNAKKCLFKSSKIRRTKFEGKLNYSPT